MDVYVTLRFHHGGKLQQKPRIKYEGGTVIDCFDVDVDKLSYFEFVDIVKEIGYNYSSCVAYIKPPKCRRVVEVKSDRDIMGIVHQLRNGDIVELYVTHLVEEAVVLPPSPPPEIGYLNDVGGESKATFDKKSSQTFEGSESLGFEEAAQPEEHIVGEELGEVLGRTSTSVGEDLGRASAGVGEDLGRASVSVGEDLGGTSSAAAAAYDIPEVGSNWESETEASDDSDNADLSDEGEDEYRSDVHEEGKIAGDEPYFDSDEAVSFEIYTDEDVNEEYEFREAITRYAVQEHVELDKYVNDATRVRVKCTVGCPWLLFGSIDSRTRDFVVKNYNPVHKCNGTTKNKLVNSKYLSERTVARKARNIVLKQIMGDHVEEFKRFLDYRDELLKTNPGSTCVVRLSEETFKGVSRGQLLVVVCKDGNNQILPLAWAVVEVENTFIWKWSIKLVRHDLELGDGTELTTITDMHKSLDKAIQDLLPNTEQRMCARHVLANWSKNLERH
ncbi:hypothetical protein KY284_009118 [Solanum tuberosum]|nr:hypothetical protein KY284_009118 [Solanum tuberosum]